MKTLHFALFFIFTIFIVHGQKSMSDFPSRRGNYDQFMKQKDWIVEARSDLYPPYMKNDIIFAAAESEFAIDGITGYKLYFNEPEHQKQLRQALKNDSILHLYSDNMYRCINIYSGKLLLSVNTRKRHTYSSPHVSSDSITMYETDGYKIYGYNLRTGEIIWIFNSESITRNQLFTLHHDRAYFSNTTIFFEINLFTGNVNWKFPIKNRIVTAPVIIDNMVYLNVLKEGLYALDMEKQEIAWHFKVVDLPFGGTFIVDDDAIYIPYWTLYAINRHNGQLIWKTNNETDDYSYDKSYISTTRNHVLAEFNYDNTTGLAVINKKTGIIEYWAEDFYYRFYKLKFENYIYGSYLNRNIHGFELLVE